MRPKILVFIDWFFPGYKAGGPIQSIRNLISALGDSFEIFVLTSDRDLGDNAPYSNVKTNEWNAYGQGASVFYTPKNQVTAALIKMLVAQLQPDFIYLNSMYSFRFTILPLWLKYRGKLPGSVVLAPRGMLQAGAMQFSPQKKKLFIRLINLAGIPGSIRFHATDEQEKKDIQQYFPAAGSIIVAPNFPALGSRTFVPVDKIPGELKLAFVSRLAPKKNIHFLLELLAQIPVGIRCHMVFRGTFEGDDYRQRCLALVEKMPPHVSVEFGGPIENELIIPFLQQHHIFALPTLGENFGHAIFEALSAGRPVLISDRTPWRDLTGKKAGWDLTLEKPENFLRVLEEVAAMDQQALNAWCQGAWDLANDYIAEMDHKSQYKKLFN